MSRRDRHMKVETAEQAAENPNPGYARIVLPESGPELERALEVIQTDRRCKKCEHFDFELGQKALTGRDNVLRQLIKERDLASVAHATDPRQIGACRYWSQGSERLHLVHAITPAKIARHFVGSSTRQNRNDPVDCPGYREVSGRVLRFFKRVFS